jgi:hypothetical protein
MSQLKKEAYKIANKENKEPFVNSVNNPNSTEESGKKRMNLLNDSYRKRYIEYIKIVLIAVFALICVWLCRILENMNYLTTSTSDFTIIKILGTSVIIGYIIYKNIDIHNLIIYDEIDYYSPANMKPTTNPTTNPTDPASQEKCPSCDSNSTYVINSQGKGKCINNISLYYFLNE